MKAEHINPFIMGCQNIFQEVAFVPLKIGSTTLKKSAYSTKDVVVMVGITGDIRGTIAMNLDEGLGKRVASNMMGGMEVVNFDEIPRSAISELNNMMMGKVCSFFAEQGKHVDITPPTLMTGNNLKLSFPQSTIISVNFTGEFGDVELDLAVKEG